MKEIILNITDTVNIRIPLPPPPPMSAAMQPEERERADRPHEVRHETDKAA